MNASIQCFAHRPPGTVHHGSQRLADLFLVLAGIARRLSLIGLEPTSPRPGRHGLLLIVGSFISLGGFFTLQPNEAAVFTLFGEYKGTARQNGFLWANPFYRKFKISLRARNLNGEKLKVNDKRGNPVEIAVVIVWRVQDTAQAVFDVDSYESFIRIQSESCVRHVASSYLYDDGEANELTLRGSGAEVAGGARKGAPGAPGARRDRHRGGAPHPSGLRARNRPSDAQAPAG